MVVMVSVMVREGFNFIARKEIEFRRWLLLELRIMEHNWIFYTHYKWDYIKQNNVMDTANGDNLSRGWVGTLARGKVLLSIDFSHVVQVHTKVLAGKLKHLIVAALLQYLREYSGADDWICSTCEGRLGCYRG